MTTLGWTGIMSQVLHYLRVVGADQSEDGRFLIRGDVVTFLGMGGDNAETVVGPDAVYFVGGQEYNLAAGLRSTSYGVGVHVII
jgi:hypothetical protein